MKIFIEMILSLELSRQKNTHFTGAVELIHLKWISILGLALSYLNKSFTYPVFIYILYLNAEGLAYLELFVVNTLVIE